MKVESRHMRSTNKTTFIMCLVLCASSYLALKNLDAASLWDDEAEVAIVGKNLAATGELTGWDGRNLLAYRDGTTLDSRLHSVQPPLMFIVAAASFRIFGVSTWSARLPFVCLGLASLLLYWRILARELPDAPRARVYAFATLALSVAFLLFIRNCRYYSLLIFFALATYHTWRSCALRAGWRNIALLSLSAAGLFYSHFLVAAAFLSALAVRELIETRSRILDKIWTTWLPFAASFLVLVAPYAIAHRIWDRPDVGANVPIGLGDRLQLIAWFERDFGIVSALSLTMIAAIMICYYVLDRNDRLLRNSVRWCAFTVLILALLGVLAVPAMVRPSGVETRYLTIAIPFGAGAVGMFLGYLESFGWPLAAIGLASVLTTNVASWGVDPVGLRWTLPAYLYEIHHPYPTAEQAASEYLQAHATQDDFVFVAPGYNNLPIEFYAGHKVKICCFLDHDSHLWDRGVSPLPPQVSADHVFPEWIVSFGEPSPGMIEFFERQTTTAAGVTQSFAYRMTTHLLINERNSQRPELDLHAFGPSDHFSRDHGGVFFYRKVQ